jgi:AcrR family transcriptional regulator
MADLADRAGVSRQAVYRAFGTRSELVEYILNIRFQEIGHAIEHHFRDVDSLEEALVECPLRAVDAGRKDLVFQAIMRTHSDHSVEQFVFRGSEEILEVTRKLWGPLLKQARDRGQLDRDISDDRYLDWIQQVEAMLSLREDLNVQQQRAVLRDFLVPSIIRKG